MNLYVQQSITIQFLKVNSVTNSSVLQIGSAGMIKPATHLYNTGGFTGPAPDIQGPIPITAGFHHTSPLVPLTSTGR
ncbi:spore germination protein GerPB [Niallia sp. Krafla_26]|uniref:spore germination protein GerPB n=1 Tax=Niallia sp. Krafla_26 TaxID=3064703 RepID=UPI003D168067